MILGLGVLVAVLVFLWRIRGHSFSWRVFIALALGIGCGYALKQWLPADLSGDVLSWYNVVGSVYTRLLRMVSIPLIMVSILSAVVRMDASKGLAKVSGLVIFVLLFTAAIAAGIGAGTARSFKLNAAEIAVGSAEQKGMEKYESRAKTADLSIQNQIINVVPTNPFAAMTGAGSNATLSVVLFSALLGAAVLAVRKERKDLADRFQAGLETVYEAVMELTWIIIELTPLGIFAIMSRTVALTDYTAIVALGKFAVASYVAIGATFLVHLALLAIFGYSPLTYLRKVWPTLTFAFTSRSSMATLPLSIDTLHTKMGVGKGLSGFAATLGTSIGQNGCAAIYPAMLAVMIAPTIGVDPFTVPFMAKLIVIITLSSFGIAGVGGGATFASIMVLSALGFPIALAGVLISIEPLIDMGRTALNVSDGLTSGLIVARLTGDVNKDVYNGR